MKKNTLLTFLFAVLTIPLVYGQSLSNGVTNVPGKLGHWFL